MAPQPRRLPETGPLEDAGTLQVLLKYAGLLEARGLPYMIVGAHAVMVHGFPRFTADLDVVVHMPVERSGEVRSVLEAAGCSRTEDRRDEFGERVATITPEGPLLEVFFTPPNPVYDREYERRVGVLVGGRKVWFLSPEDLVLRKLVNSRLRRANDLDDAVSVVATQGAKLDLSYIRKHCGTYRVCEVFEQALRTAEAARREPGA